MHRLLARAQPSFHAILLIESGPRKVTEQILRYLYTEKCAAQIDVLTCFEGPPENFDTARGTLYSVNEPEVRAQRRAFISKLARKPYTIVALLCTGSPILQRWKWILAIRSGARLIVVNEEARYFGLEVWNHRSIRLMLYKRLNPFEDHTRESLAAILFTFLMSILVAPFTITYLLFYTSALNLRALLRSRKAGHVLAGGDLRTK